MSNIRVECAKWPGNNNCSLRMEGEEHDVLPAAAHHRSSTHGDAEAGLHEQISTALDDQAKPFASRI